MDTRPAARPPRLPHLQPVEAPTGPLDALELHDARVVAEPERDPVHTRHVRLAGCDVRGLRLAATDLDELDLADVVLDGGDISNVGAHRGSLRRVDMSRVRGVGFRVEEGVLQDVRVTDGTLMLASFARSGLERVHLEGVDLREASFLDARLRHVTLVGCDLAGADLRGATLRDCVLRGSSLDGVRGIDALRGVVMPWPDVVASAGALAEALGIVIEDAG